MKRLILNDFDGGTLTARRETVERIIADLQAQGIASARVFEKPMYGVEIDPSEWEAAKAANKRRMERLRAQLKAK
jgi:hypothetical protein